MMVLKVPSNSVERWLLFSSFLSAVFANAFEKECPKTPDNQDCFPETWREKKTPQMFFNDKLNPVLRTLRRYFSATIYGLSPKVLFYEAL